MKEMNFIPDCTHHMTIKNYGLILHPIRTLVTKYFSGNQIEKNEMGGAYSTYGGKEVRTGFWWGDLREGDHLGDPGVDGQIRLKLIFKKWDGGMDWIELAQDRDRWRALVNAVMNLRVP
jgi:hypothetical protein